MRVALTEAGVLTASESISYAPGTYTGVAGGRGGGIVATVTVSGDAIESIEIVGEKESSGISAMPMEVIPQEILSSQSLGVDVIAGATATQRTTASSQCACIRLPGAPLAAC